MHLYRTEKGFVLNRDGESRVLPEESNWDGLINREELYDYLTDKWEVSAKSEEGISMIEDGLLAPIGTCLLYTSPSPRDQRGSRMPSSA